ncbi:triple tyrosine motif-containing protein [Flavitalea sp. BT771]|uniref:ligand-binding sensor domain-containing protein n=1 Tax=Flavitalea sp. BT771 TaxID=3063329 RepID=UPI0026E3499A|nr:triple tyrosine motif-containing protein [Flavitalea sp. BT771]MDO6434747.1 triple tyrosine motif-containing protein [Flavitalea sp. BT771]MDV6223647.1 triple tyrosine motif-containing protein [Flavitalea sp. BT771]
MRNKALLLLLVSYWVSTCLAQGTIGRREVVSYEKQTYNAGAQNWDIRQDVQGRVYFANNEGLLSFDGIYWKLYPLPNKTIVRSIGFGPDHRIYAGGQDEIGYFSPDRSGRLGYTSLKNLVPEADRKFADIWNIVSYGRSIFFRSDNKILCFTHDTIQVFRPFAAWIFMGLADGKLIAQDAEKGLLVFKQGAWEPFLAAGALPKDIQITSVIPIGQDSSLVTTPQSGLFILNGDRLIPFTPSGKGFDPKLNFSGAVRVDEESFIVGTYTNGFYLINKRGQVLENLSKREGLQNNNVRSVFMDRDHNIWVGLDSGIDFIAFNNAIKHINPAIMNSGSGYAAVIHHNKLYLGLSNGIYAFPLPPDAKDLSYVPDACKIIADGQTWGLYLMNDQLLAGKEEGFFRVRDDKMEPVMKGRGFWTFQPLEDMLQGTLLAAGNYQGVRLFAWDGKGLEDKGNITGFSESARFVAVDDKNTIWVSHPYRGVYKLPLSTAADAAFKLYTDKNGLPSSLNNHVYKVKNRVVIATEKGVYEYNPGTDRFEPSAYFREIFGDQSVRYLKEDPSGNIWFIQEKAIGVVDFSTFKPSVIYLPELKSKMLSGFEHIYPVNDNNVFLGGEKGFYHINFKKYKQNNHPLSVYIRTVKAIGRTDSLLFGGYFGEANENPGQGKERMPSVSHHWNSFHFEYASPLFEQQSNIEYCYLLEGFDKGWSEWSKRTEKDYTNLPAGAYTFLVKARNNLGNESAASAYGFTVQAPWYQSFPAYAVYLLLGVCLAFYLYRRHHKKLMAERLKHQEEQKRQAYLHQLELEKSEKEVVKLRNEKLESEIEFKNSELATTAMHLVQKEEFITRIKGELLHLEKTGMDKAAPGEVKKLLRSLSEEEELHKEWEQFSIHFNKVHSDLLIILKEKYPSLKAHELKLCAYLRMNLSSKEIARLMSISVRGVEISRYRVRKKLQLPTETNLFQFLFDLQRDGMKG